jgi:hypothetical protein
MVLFYPMLELDAFHSVNVTVPVPAVKVVFPPPPGIDVVFAVKPAPTTILNALGYRTITIPEPPADAALEFW